MTDPFPTGQREGEFEAMPVEEPRRAASVTLRTDEVRQARAASLDAANKSLADALRITYRLLQVVMVALAGLFLFSGFQQVNQSESGLRVSLGRITTERLDPGFQFSLPYPLGEIIKVPTGSQSLELTGSFFPDLNEAERGRPLDELGIGKPSLVPGKDGSLLTGDSNIAHAQFSVVFTRARPAEFIRNLDPSFESALVRAAVERAAVQVAASSPIEDLLKPSGAAGGGESGVESRVRRAAQGTLDQAMSGLVINQVLLRVATPPLRVRGDFNQVQIAQSNAGKARDQALGERSKILNEVAGAAHQPLLDLIDDYEAMVDTGDRGADALLALIGDVLQGQKNGAGVTINGRTYETVRASGEASTIVSDAQQYRSSVVQQAQRQAEIFRAKREQYRANPSVFVAGEMVRALGTLYANPAVQTYRVPANAASVEVLISPDADVARAAERERNRRTVESNPRVREMTP